MSCRLHDALLHCGTVACRLTDQQVDNRLGVVRDRRNIGFSYLIPGQDPRARNLAIMKISPLSWFPQSLTTCSGQAFPASLNYCNEWGLGKASLFS